MIGCKGKEGAAVYGRNERGGGRQPLAPRF